MLKIVEKVLLAPFASFRIGGPARFFVEVTSLVELQEALMFAKEKKIQYFILGGGTNLLFADQGFDGLVIKLKLNEISFKENVLNVQAGVPLIKVVNFAAQNGLTGLESLAGIPGTIGGAVRGNAGAFGAETSNLIGAVEVFDCEDFKLKTFSKQQCDFSYRASLFKRSQNLIILNVSFELAKGNQDEIQIKTNQTIQKRVATGLHGIKSAGSFFLNPEVENRELLEQFAKENGAPSRNGKIPAGWFIEQLDLKGKRMGGALISEKHANYLVNDNEARAEDIIMLESFIKQQVRDKFGIQLQSEVNHLGF